MTTTENASNETVAARTRGYDAGFRGDAPTSNPYECGSVLYDEWKGSYTKGKTRRKKIDREAQS